MKWLKRLWQTRREVRMETDGDFLTAMEADCDVRIYDRMHKEKQPAVCATCDHLFIGVNGIKCRIDEKRLRNARQTCKRHSTDERDEMDEFISRLKDTAKILKASE